MPKAVAMNYRQPRAFFFYKTPNICAKRIVAFGKIFPAPLRLRDGPGSVGLRMDLCVLSTFLLFYFQWKTDASGLRDFYRIIRDFKML